MKRLLTLFALLMLAGCSASKNNAQPPLAEAPRADESPAQAVADSLKQDVQEPQGQYAHGGFFWKVSDSNSSVYLLGSVHFADSSFYPLDTAITEAFFRSSELGVELDMSDTAIIAEIMKQSVVFGMLEAGKSLDKILPADVQKSLDSLCAAWNLPVGILNRYKPWSAAMTLSSLAIQRKGYDPAFGIDFAFINAAHTAGKPIISLETVEDQILALTGEGMPDSIGIFYMKSTIQDLPLLDSSISTMVRAWKTGDISLFQASMEMEMSPKDAKDSLLSKELEERVYFVRNRKMAKTVEDLLAKDRSVFIVVGAAHLAGKDESVIDLLRAKGFTVERK